jgi:adenylate cyclase
MSPVVARRLRVASGLILMTYLTTHFLNHALGLVSLEAMDAGRDWFLALWRNPVGTAVLYLALVVHGALALRSLYRRRHLRLPAWEAWQLLLGLTIPALLAGHIVGTRVAWALFDATDSYGRIVLALWGRPAGFRQSLLLPIAWTHGCLGLHFWLRLRAWYRRITPWLLAIALLIPVLAWLGFAAAGRDLSERAESDPRWRDALAQTTRAPGPAEREALENVYFGILIAYGGALGLVLAARGVRRLRQRSQSFRVTYPGERDVVVPIGFTVLEASRFAGIPHASVCGGRGRCSTCRVRIVRGVSGLPEPGPDEVRVLKRVDAPPDVRLACQLRPTHDLAVAPVLPATASAADAAFRADHRGGRERELAVLFADLRGFTSIAEHKLPYDVVFLLNRYFEAVGGAITRAGGIPNQFTGDGVMALFGVETGASAGCREALVAARGMVEGVAALSRELADDLPSPFRIGIGIHVGPAIVGQMGYGHGIYFTAVGDTVHVASRLEQLTKDYGASLVISENVAVAAGVDVSAFPRHEVTVRNRAVPVAVRVIDDVRRLAAPLV